MKKVIAIAALVVSAQVSAFWGLSDASGYGGAYDRAQAEVAGAGEAGADFTLDLNVSVRMRSEARASGSGYGHGAGDAYRHNAYIPYYGAPYGFAPAALNAAAE